MKHSTSGVRDYGEVRLTEERPAAQVKLSLGGFGAISGSVVDEETGKPLPNLQLTASRAQQRGPRFLPFGGITTRAGEDGRFLLTGLSPGDYAVEIAPQAGREKRVLPRFTEEDLGATDLDYEHTWWPGGHGVDSVLPVRVASGATVPIGTLHAGRIPYYRVHVRIPVSNCEPGDKVRVAESVTDSGSVTFGPPLAETPCAKEILLTGYPRGSYRLLLNIMGRSRENGGTASVPFLITDRNIEVSAPILPGVTLDGVVVAAAAAKPPDFSKLSVALRGVDGLGDPGERATPDNSGKFQISYVRPVGHTVFIVGLDANHYVKEIRYNGIPLSDETVPLDEPSMARSLTVVIDDKVAAIAGTVATSDGPVSRPTVLAVKWPIEDMPHLARAQGDNTGKFQIGGMAPGEYRIIALDSVPEGLMNATLAVFQQVLSAGRKVELSPGGFQNLVLEPADLAMLRVQR